MTRIELSIRRNFGDSRDFGPPMLAVGSDLHIGDDAIHELRHICEGKTVLVLLHGYNSPVESARAAYQDIEAPVQDLYDVAIRCYWPGSRKTLGFPWAFERADDAGCLLRAILDGIRAKALDVVTHSLAARVWAWCFGGLPGPWRYAILTGAAIPRESLDTGRGKHYRATQAFHRVVVAHSKHDPALRAYGWTTWHKALGKYGPTPDSAPNVIGVDCSADTPDHGGYRRSEILYRAWREMIERKAA